ncbi:MAG: segregation/condensation protein A, partial [Actinobacteria bacterium]|nr:segregation/condensation protein A [Actinomycetota bacterium]
ARLRSLHRATFRELIADCTGTYEIVARFLAVLELYRDGQVSLEQENPLGDLFVTWNEHSGDTVRDDLEEYDG